MINYRYVHWTAPGESRTYFKFREVPVPKSGEVILVHDMRTGKADMVLAQLRSQEDIDDWDMKLEREFVWKPNNHHIPDPPTNSELNWSSEPQEVLEDLLRKDAIDPPHYKDIVPGMQYIEMMQYILKDKSGVVAHLYGQIYKYLMRSGKKDHEVQELEKVLWYLKFLIAHLKSGREIKVEEIDHLLKIEGSVL